MQRISTRIAISIVLTLLLAHAAFTWVPTPGLIPFGSFSGGPFDIVDNQSLNVHFEIPVLSKAGRGLAFNYPFRYDSTIWRVNGSAWTPATPALCLSSSPGHSLGDQPFESPTVTEALKKENVKRKFESFVGG